MRVLTGLLSLCARCVCDRYAEATLETCAYAGTGNVLKVQAMLRLCTDHLTEQGQAEHQAVAVLGIALTNIGKRHLGCSVYCRW